MTTSVQQSIGIVRYARKSKEYGLRNDSTWHRMSKLVGVLRRKSFIKLTRWHKERVVKLIKAYFPDEPQVEKAVVLLHVAVKVTE